ncbi:SMI1/KNR4 family protein [Paenilisteria rocourtiae]|uniref:SUKH superfamily protein n=1 Tax=Listeria rocourtiae TaxID=647910 RepID=A0A4R6ZSH8_9LIST|nr:SMI1/KNR4 family protein [Listeria rocourtiae]MBC1605542.1 SMI1/KNR4 family protein [Listeria rocourtiae]TDR55660.1 SUKH superfamily protein [Listeria rocourtiae]
MNIWREDNEKAARLEQQHIELVEKTFGVSLPTSYIQALQNQNGGYLKTNAVRVEFEVEDGEKHILLDSLYGIGAEDGIIETEYYREEWEITKDNIVIIGGDGHSFVAFDYEGTTTSPKIVYIDTDCDESHTICDSFEALLDLMYELE